MPSFSLLALDFLAARIVLTRLPTSAHNCWPRLIFLTLVRSEKPGFVRFFSLELFTRVAFGWNFFYFVVSSFTAVMGDDVGVFWR